MNNFASSYKQLNKEQKSAVDQIDGPVMVVAGPGTGKTQTIALRIANILKQTDTDPSSILALTYTESGARAMRERLVGLIGSPAYEVEISTFHGFCAQVIRNQPDYFTLDPSAEPLSDLEQLKLIHSLIDKGDLSLLRPIGAPHHYTSAIIFSLGNLKREGVSPDQYSDLLTQDQQFLDSDKSVDLAKTKRNKRIRDLAKNQELLTLYRAYEAELTTSHRLDFDDMINQTITALRDHSDLLLSLQERYLYLLVDEYQDTNTSQNELLLLLASYWGQEANLFAVGDPDQCIYRFSGASIENQLGFVKSYPNATIITLQDNYRSTQFILDAAHSLISHNELRINDVVSDLDPHLNSVQGEGVSPRLALLSSGTAEQIFVATDIKSKLDSGIKPSEIAVLVRTNAEAHSLADTLSRYQISYTLAASGNILTTTTITHLVRLLRVVAAIPNNAEDEDLFALLFHKIFKIDPLDILRVTRLASSKRLSLFDTISDPGLLDSLTLSTREAIDTTLSLLTRFSRLDSAHTFPETFELILNESGYLTWLLSLPDSHHHLIRLNTLFDELKKMAHANPSLNLKSFLENLTLIQENRLKLKESVYGKNPNSITLTTTHSAKGLEWDHVYITRVVDRHWGNKIKRELIHLPDTILTNTDLSEKDKNEEDRCLFYVALTRARLSLTLSYATEYSSKGSSHSTLASMFLSELGDTTITELDTSSIEAEASSHLENLLTTIDSHDYSEDEKAFLTELVEKFTLSPTSLNAYLECPYKFKLDKLLRVPHSKKPHLAFGTAVHASLEHFYQEYKKSGNVPTKDYLLGEFDSALARELLTKKDHSLRLAEGKKILSAYFDFFKDDFKQPLYLEKAFRVNLDDISLSGKIDRIELTKESKNTIKVIDYKTGKGKTMGQIVGDTKDSRGDLKRQLVFYKLLTQLDRELVMHKYQFESAELDFVSVPATKNKSGRYSVAITREEVEDLKVVIRDAMKRIRALEFPRTSDTKHCGKCDFRDHCWPDGILNS